MGCRFLFCPGEESVKLQGASKVPAISKGITWHADAVIGFLVGWDCQSHQ
jgi:hypothetical protein